MSTPAPPSQISPEFFVRVNDFLALANRIGSRYDTGHAQVAMAHAFARYSAYHYRSTIKQDSQAEREAFARYMGELLSQLVADHLADVVGPVGSEAAADTGAPEAGNSGSGDATGA